MNEFWIALVVSLIVGIAFLSFVFTVVKKVEEAKGIKMGLRNRIKRCFQGFYLAEMNGRSFVIQRLRMSP